MGKSVGWLKKLKKVKDVIGDGLSWVNNNIVKPFRPMIDTGLEMAGYGTIGKTALDFGSGLIDKIGSKNNAKDTLEYIGDFILDTQKTPTEKFYSKASAPRMLKGKYDSLF